VFYFVSPPIRLNTCTHKCTCVGTDFGTERDPTGSHWAPNVGSCQHTHAPCLGPIHGSCMRPCWILKGPMMETRGPNMANSKRVPAAIFSNDHQQNVWAHRGPFRSKYAHVLSCWDPLDPIYVPFGSTMGPHAGLFWAHVGPMLGPFWAHLESIMNRIWAHIFLCFSPVVHF
jgi:hypothetical protein